MWKLKVLVQFILSWLPFGEAINHGLQRLRNSFRGGTERQIRNRFRPICNGLHKIEDYKRLDGASVVEVGTGWTPVVTFLLYGVGASEIFTYDHIRHLRERWGRLTVKVIFDHLDEIVRLLDLRTVDGDRVGGRISRIAQSDAPFFDTLERNGINYLAPGDAAATALPDGTIDILYSHAVLEHVPEKDVRRLVREAKRVLRPDGIFYALIGLHDHYSGFDRKVSRVNFLRYPEWLWAFFIKNSISYHNRMREVDFLEILESQGAEIVKVWSGVDAEALRRVKAMKVDKRFAKYTDEQLAVTRTEIIARFP